MTHNETCFCTKRTIEFTSRFDGDVVTRIWCPACASKAPGDAVVFELCSPGELAGVWAVKYNAGELKRLDEHFRDTDDYYVSLLMSGVCGPSAVKTHFKGGGVCRILGMRHGPDAGRIESTLDGRSEKLADEAGERWPGDVVSGPQESPRRGKRRRK